MIGEDVVRAVIGGRQEKEPTINGVRLVGVSSDYLGLPKGKYAFNIPLGLKVDGGKFKGKKVIVEFCLSKKDHIVTSRIVMIESDILLTPGRSCS